jgi:hypothetical protein
VLPVLTRFCVNAIAIAIRLVLVVQHGGLASSGEADHHPEGFLKEADGILLSLARRISLLSGKVGLKPQIIRAPALKLGLESKWGSDPRPSAPRRPR